MRATLTAGEAPAVPAMPAAFEALFRKEYARVVAIAQRIVRDADEAEDVAQDVFVSFYKKHPGDAGYAPAWLHAAAAHTALNWLRSRSRRATRESAHGRGIDVEHRLRQGAHRAHADHPLARATAFSARRLTFPVSVVGRPA